jgi:RNA-binding protein
MSLSNKQISKLRSLAQRLEPVVYVGKAGVTDDLLAAVEMALGNHELIKIKFTAFKEAKESLSTGMAARTQSELVWIIGHVVVLYRAQPDPARRKVLADE